MDPLKTPAIAIMNRVFVTVTDRMSLKEARDVLCRERATAAPVVRKDGRPVGVVTLVDLLLSGAGKRAGRRPPFAPIVDLDSIESEGMEEEFSDDNHEGRTVENVMTATDASVGPDASLLDVCRVMVRGKVPIVLVMREREILGTVGYPEVIRALGKAKGRGPRRGGKSKARPRSR